MIRIRALVVALLLSAACPAAFAQNAGVGQLLYAAPSMADDNFRETVLLVLVHDEQGSRAVALNRPTWVTPPTAFPEIDQLATSDATLFFGGPVSPNLLVVLFRAGDVTPDEAGSQRILDDIYITTDPTVLTTVEPTASGASRVRLYAGHAAWGPGQLEAEIAAGSWRVVAGTPDRVFAENPTALWNSIPAAGGGVTASR